MTSVTFLLARRYLQGASRKKSIGIILSICCIGIFIATFSLALIISIMHGFEKATHKKLQGIHSDIIIHAPGQTINLEALENILNNEFSASIAAYSPSEIHPGLLSNPKLESMPVVIIIKGIDPEREAKTSVLEQSIITPLHSEKQLATVLGNNAVLIGKKLAELLDVECGNHIELLIPTDEQTKKNAIQLETVTIQIGGIFKTGIEEIDANTVICSLDFLQRIVPDAGVSFIHISTNPHIAIDKVINQLRNRTGLDVYSWKDLYPPLVAALTLEKYAMFFVLSLIVLVASMSIISLLYMLITYKRGDIAILQAIGYPKTKIRNVFLLIGMGVSFISSVLGLASAWCVGLLIDKYPCIQLPDAYFVTNLPIALEGSMFALVFFTVMMLSFFATWIPLHLLKEKNIARLLRLEA
jgi:ABC-type lipoprotein release transport system permease subunit